MSASNGKHPDTEVRPRTARRRFTAAYKRKIVEEARVQRSRLVDELREQARKQAQEVVQQAKKEAEREKERIIEEAKRKAQLVIENAEVEDYSFVKAGVRRVAGLE